MKIIFVISCMVLAWFGNDAAFGSPLFELRNEHNVSNMDQVGFRYFGLKTKDGGMEYNTQQASVEGEQHLIWNPFSLSGASGCIGSACGGSGCLGSLCGVSGCFGSGCGASGCGGSGCAGSGCGGSACGTSGCVGSVCAGSVCVGSACVGSVCVGSVCAGSSCGGSACVVSVCAGSSCAGSVCVQSTCSGTACVQSDCGGGENYSRKSAITKKSITSLEIDKENVWRISVNQDSKIFFENGKICSLKAEQVATVHSPYSEIPKQVMIEQDGNNLIIKNGEDIIARIKPGLK